MHPTRVCRGAIIHMFGIFCISCVYSIVSWSVYLLGYHIIVITILIGIARRPAKRCSRSHITGPHVIFVISSPNAFACHSLAPPARPQILVPAGRVGTAGGGVRALGFGYRRCRGCRHGVVGRGGRDERAVFPWCLRLRELVHLYSRHLTHTRVPLVQAFLTMRKPKLVEHLEYLYTVSIPAAAFLLLLHGVQLLGSPRVSTLGSKHELSGALKFSRRVHHPSPPPIMSQESGGKAFEFMDFWPFVLEVCDVMQCFQGI